MARGLAHRSRAAALPDWIPPQLTQLVDAAPEGDGWLHEIKFDGYRMHARLDRGDVRLLNHRCGAIFCTAGSLTTTVEVVELIVL